MPALVPPKPNGGKGKVRLSAPIEAIIADAIERFYLTAQKPALAAVVKEVRRRCRMSDLKPPVFNTVHARVRQLLPERVTKKRLGSKAAACLRPGCAGDRHAGLDGRAHG